MLHSDFPVVDDKYKMTEEWLITLDQPHNRRTDEGSLVLWRPGFTVWINVWGNDNNESIMQRLKWISSDASPDAFETQSVSRGPTQAYSYRLNESENGEVTYSYNGYILAEDSHIQITVYFNSEPEFKKAKSIIESIEFAQP